jgi:hypothetical protein
MAILICVIFLKLLSLHNTKVIKIVNILRSEPRLARRS